MSVLNTEALFRSNLEKTNKKSMVLVATKKEEANDVPGGLLHVHIPFLLGLSQLTPVH